MKKISLKHSSVPAAVCAGLCLFGGGVMQAQAQPTPAQKRQLKEFLGNRAEVGIVLGASDSASSGSYTIDSDRSGQDDLDYSLLKFGGGGEIGQARKLGNTDYTWNPVVMGSIGVISGDNRLTTGGLKNNDLEDSALGMTLGGGVALHFSERFTVTPTIGVLYGHYDVNWHVRNPAGRAVKSFIEDDVDTIGVTPGIGIAYKQPMGKCTWEFSAHYTFYGTTEMGGSDLDAGGSSHIFEQRADIDIPLDASLWGCPLHTGGYVSLTEVAGDLGDTMNSDVWATIHGRFLLNTEGKSWAWKMSRLGLGVSAIAGDNFTGWDAGVEVGFKF